MTLTRTTAASVLVLSIALILAATAIQPVAAISSGSSLVWLAEPATAQIDETITTELGKPNGDPIKVGILNGSGKRTRKAGIPIRLVIQQGSGAAGAELSESLVETNGEGVAVFRPSIDLEGFGYRLVAKAADRASLNSGHIASTPGSREFDVRDGNVTSCQGTCNDADETGNTKAQVVNGNANGYLVFKLGDTGAGCGAATSEILTFDLQGTVSGRTKATIEVSVGAGPDPEDVCLSSDQSFIDKDGIEVPAGQAGLLADCDVPVETDDDPCIKSRSAPGTDPFIITFSVPPGDPRAYVK